MRLSIIVPSIRPQNLFDLYKSIDVEDFEMIVVGPNMPKFYSDKLKFITSCRSPNACQQIGLCSASGEYITFAADDGFFIPGELDNALSIASKYTIVVGKYLEGDNPNPDMWKEEYYKFKYHKAYRLKGVPQDGLIFNCGIISRALITDLGGWNAERFQCTTFAHADLGIRAISTGVKMFLMDEVLFKCSHQPGKTGDHLPIHNAMKKDLKNFQEVYSTPYHEFPIRIDIYNWKYTQPRWKERFK